MSWLVRHPSPWSPWSLARNELDPYKQLWAERPSEEVRLKQYRFVDEGPTVLVMLDLNDHLPIGHDASAAVA